MITAEPIILNLNAVNLSDEQFYQLCQDNENWQLERTAQGELIIMPPVGGLSGNREADLNADLVIWNRQVQFNTFANLVQRVEKTLTVNFLSSEAWQK